MRSERRKSVLADLRSIALILASGLVCILHPETHLTDGQIVASAILLSAGFMIAPR